jgi:hypothetical protein
MSLKWRDKYFYLKKKDFIVMKWLEKKGHKYPGMAEVEKELSNEEIPNRSTNDKPTEPPATPTNTVGSGKDVTKQSN